MNNNKLANIIVDPSLLFAESSIDKTVSLIQSHSGSEFGFSISDKVYELINSRLFDYDNSIFKFFLHRAKPADLEKIYISFLEIRGSIEPFSASLNEKEEYLEYYEILKSLPANPYDVYDESNAEVIFDEFIFMQKHSVIISRIRKTFAKMIQAGSVCLEIGDRTLDKIIRRTLRKKDKDMMEDMDRLRAFAKWFAVGGNSISQKFEPNAVFLLNMVIDYFMLFDPDQ